MLVQLEQKLSRMHQSTYAITTSLGSPYQYEVQRVWLADVPLVASPQLNNTVQTVQVEFADGTTDTATVTAHPTQTCKSILTVIAAAPPPPIVRIFGPPLYVGRLEDLKRIYSASTTLFPFLFLLDNIKSTADYNVLHVSEFTLLLVGLVSRGSSVDISQLNLVSLYISEVLRNIDVTVNAVREFARISLDSDTWEVYIQAFTCETYLLQRYL